jgi:4-amino-4-deoxy-L-arabinose transferase-like glycosyltransferase
MAATTQHDRQATGQQRDWRRTFVAITPTPGAGLVLLLLASLVIRIVWLSRTGSGLIFDEAYYVHAAQIIDHIAVPGSGAYHDAPFGLDPNHEHPPLGKVLFALSIYLFGDNGVGWRLPSVIAGMAAIVLIYAIVRALGGRPWLAVVAALIFSADNLVLVHSRIATLDMPILAFALLGAWLWLRELPRLAGGAVAIAALIKLTAVYAIVGILLVEAGSLLWEYRNTRAWNYRGAVSKTLKAAVVFIPAWFLGLWALDYFFTSYHSPLDHMAYMLHYGINLTHPQGPSGIESDPWQWLANEVQITYFRVDQNILVNGKVAHSQPLVWFRGAMNPVIIGTFPLALGYCIWRAWSLGDRLAMWTLGWFAGNYLPFFPLSMVQHRVSYIYYFLPCLPAVAIAIAAMLRQVSIPAIITVTYLIGVLIALYAYFPFRTF